MTRRLISDLGPSSTGTTVYFSTLNGFPSYPCRFQLQESQKSSKYITFQFDSRLMMFELRDLNFIFPCHFVT